MGSTTVKDAADTSIFGMPTLDGICFCSKVFFRISFNGVLFKEQARMTLHRGNLDRILLVQRMRVVAVRAEVNSVEE